MTTFQESQKEFYKSVSGDQGEEVKNMLQRDPTLLKALLEDDHGLVWVVCLRGRTEVLRVLLTFPESFARIHIGGFKGYTPMAACAWNGHVETAKVLLADPRVNPGWHDNLGTFLEDLSSWKTRARSVDDPPSWSWAQC
jgi:hypothetical protein